MGDIADMILEGELCECCGVYMGDACGYPRKCAGCRRDARAPTPSSKVACPKCGKKVKAVGLKDHLRDTHKEV